MFNYFLDLANETFYYVHLHNWYEHTFTQAFLFNVLCSAVTVRTTACMHVYTQYYINICIQRGRLYVILLISDIYIYIYIYIQIFTHIKTYLVLALTL